MADNDKAIALGHPSYVWRSSLAFLLARRPA